MTRIWLKAQ